MGQQGVDRAGAEAEQRGVDELVHGSPSIRFVEISTAGGLTR
jgi:hypothetical protein